MDKFEKDGKVAVLVSGGFGAGWSTWNTQYGDGLVFDPGLVQLVLDKSPPKVLVDYARAKWPKCYTGGIDSVGELKVEWLEKGTQFYIHEYDGAESLRTTEDLVLTA